MTGRQWRLLAGLVLTTACFITGCFVFKTHAVMLFVSVMLGIVIAHIMRELESYLH